MSTPDGWSLPNHGVTHMVNLKPSFRVTAVDYGAFVQCGIFVPGRAFTAADSGEFSSLEEAREWGERTAASFGCVKGGAA